MKLSIKATPEEMQKKGNMLISALAKALSYHNPELADNLYKAELVPDIQLKYLVLNDISKNLQEIYRKHNAAMLQAIFKVINNGVKFSKPIEKSERNMEKENNLYKFFDISSPVIQAENDTYAKIKHVLLSMGYPESDFDKDGRLYGKSINELLDVLTEDSKK